jgi:RimJ/RimL family protein N-acetyltransferase
MASVATLRGERVVLRDWTDADFTPFAALNADPDVMRHLTKRLTPDESDAMARRIREHLDDHGFGLWALDVPAAPGEVGMRRFAGFVGLARVPFELPVAGLAAQPIEIGWRLARDAWGHGYATEAARLALRHAFEVLAVPQVVSFTALVNVASQAVMSRIGLKRRAEFDHPRLEPGHALRGHVLFAQDAPSKVAP